jgi:hypothetical protein
MAIAPDYGSNPITLAQAPLLLSEPLFDVDTTNFTSTSTAVGGALTFSAPAPVLSIRGQIYTDYTYTTLKDNIVVNSIVNGLGEFTISGLTPGKTYYGRSIGYAASLGTGQSGVYNYFSFTVPAYSADLFNRTAKKFQQPSCSLENQQRLLLASLYLQCMQIIKMPTYIALQ